MERHCNNCGMHADHILVYPSRVSFGVRYVAICSICLHVSDVVEFNNDPKGTNFVFFHCSKCRMPVRGKIVSDDEKNSGNQISHIRVLCPRCGNAHDLILEAKNNM